ncbi:MAG TPA: hypothetical protein VK427_02055, partial [Kofleriaceae bacterium]|nr:hypothetical protein [Kofleriaceae bacterium]
WPVFAKTGLPYMLEERNGKPGFWAVRAWIESARVPETVNGAMRAPARAREVLAAMGWVASPNMDFAAETLTFNFRGAVSHFEVGAAAAMSTGLPQGRQAIVERDGNQGLTVTLALDDASVEPGRPHAMTTSEAQRALQAAADFTRLGVDPTGHAHLMSSWVRPLYKTGNGVINVELNRAVCATLFGFEQYHGWLGKKAKRDPADEPQTPKLALANFYGRPIPGQLTHYGDIVEAGESLRLEVLVDWPHHHPDSAIYDAPPMVTPSKFGNVSLLQCAWRFERLDGASAGPVPKRASETQATSLAESIHRFRLAPGEAHGTYRVTCDARFDEYFEPATFSRDIVVMSSSAAMSKLASEAFSGLGADNTDRKKSAWTGDVRPGFQPTGVAGAAADPMARDRVAQRDRLHHVAEYLRGSAASAEAVESIDREVARQERSEKLLASDRDKGWQPFQVRGTYLSRTEGLASGPLDLHGTVHVQYHQDSYAGDGPATTMRVRNDKVVVRLRDLSRRFEQSDFVFEGKAETFDDALRDAFEDLAVAYPKGMVSVEAEQIRATALRTGDGAPGADAARGPSTGKVIGFQRSTETTWKKVKAAVWDPVASVAVNLGAVALMTLVPGSAAIVAPALVAYNSAPAADRIKTDSDRGTLTVSTFAMSTGEIALNLLPLVSRAKPFTAGWYAVETANWGGQVALMGAGAVDMAQQLQATQVAALAQEYQQLLELQKTSLPSDPGLAMAEDRIRHKAAALDGEISRQFLAQLKGNFFQIVAGSVIHNTSSHARTAILDYLAGRRGNVTTEGGGGPPSSGGAPRPTVGPLDGIDPDGSDRTRDDGERAPGHAAGTLPSQSGSLAAAAAADKRLRTNGGGFHADVADLHHVQTSWPGRAQGDTVTPIHYDPNTSDAHFDVLRGSERIRVSAAVPKRITLAQELETSANRVIGKPVSATAGHRILRELNMGRLQVLSELGVDVPVGMTIRAATEFGLGETTDHRHFVVLGQPAAVDWAYLPGLSPKAHTHPSTAGNDLQRWTGEERVSLARVLQNTPDPLIARELVMPSPPDVALMARLGVDEHRVLTPFVVRNGDVLKPPQGDVSPRLEWVIRQPREVGRMASGATVYEALLVGDVAGTTVVQTKVWSVEPIRPSSHDAGAHFMSQPAMTSTTSRRVSTPKKTRAGGPELDPRLRLMMGAQAVTSQEITALASKHGADAINWSAETLEGQPAKRLLDALEPAALTGMRDVTAAEALMNLETFGASNIDKTVPPLSGRLLQVKREQLGNRVARALVEQRLATGKVAVLHEQALNLASSTVMTPLPLSTNSVVLDSNVLAAIKELMAGAPWAQLDEHKRNGINWLRKNATPALGSLSSDPPARDVASIIGENYDLRAANSTLGENAPLMGLERGGFEITVSRQSPQYVRVLEELARPPQPIGEVKGDADRAIVADAMFAAGPGVPLLMTGDNAMINRLFARYCTAAAQLPKLKHKQTMAQAIHDAHPNGYYAHIPDGSGGTRTILVVAMVK